MTLSEAHPEPLVEVRNVTVRAGGREILDHVDLSVFRGEIVTLIGLNGAGKSTLARVLLGLTAPDEGEVHRMPGLKIGYSPQHLQRDPALPISVRRFLNLDDHHHETALKQVLNDVGAAEVMDTPLSDISGGELHRVLLARSLLRHPDLLVLDEPLAGVDVTSQSDLYRVIGDIRDRYDCGVLLVSHDLHVVMAATDRVVCLNHHVCCTGHPHAITSHPQFVSLFGKQVADVVAVYAHSHDHAHDSEGHPVPLDEAESRARAANPSRGHD
jgi:zinc transport system ATP-binding protein